MEQAPILDPEIQQRANFENSQKLQDVFKRTIDATVKIGGALMKVASDIFSMFKR